MDLDIEIDSYLRFVLALVFVLGLIALLSVGARKLGFGHNTTMMRGKHRRLGIVEIMPLDARRKLVLIKRDDKEHLLVLGPGSETVVESGIENGDEPQDDETEPSPHPTLKAITPDRTTGS